MTKESYQKYLKSDHWKRLKEKKAYRTEKKCAVCPSIENIQLHHLIYRNWINVKPKDLMWLCRTCHQITHDLLKSGRLKYKSRSPRARYISTKFHVRKEIKRRYNKSLDWKTRIRVFLNIKA